LNRLDELLNAKRKKNQKRKMGNQKKVWSKKALASATIVIDGDD